MKQGKYIISKRFDFCASHCLEGLRADHPCRRIHGHNYQIIVELEKTELDDVGMVRDYRALSVIKEWFDTVWDHQHLNSISLMNGINPTAENIARVVYNQVRNYIPEVVAVTVKETDKTAARYERRF